MLGVLDIVTISSSLLLLEKIAQKLLVQMYDARFPLSSKKIIFHLNYKYDLNLLQIVAYLSIHL